MGSVIGTCGFMPCPSPGGIQQNTGRPSRSEATVWASERAGFVTQNKTYIYDEIIQYLGGNNGNEKNQENK
jgi:hypothetical protein